MTLNTAVGVLTQPGATGNQTIDLSGVSANFDPRLIFAWTTGLPAPAGTGVNAVIGWGVGTYRSATVGQGFNCHFWTDAAATMNVNSESGTDALLVLRPDGGSTARDLEIDLVSMSSTTVVINWVNLHTTASIQVNYMILGGTAVADALAWGFTHSATAAGVNSDFTVATGFGTLDALFVSHTGDVSGLLQLAKIALGWAKDDQHQRYMVANQVEGNTTALDKLLQGADMLEPDQTSDVDTALGSWALNPRASWPTDGFQVGHSASNSFSEFVVGLAIRGGSDLVTMVGSDVTPTTVGNQDLPVGGGAVPKAIMIWGGNLPTSAGFDLTHSDLLAWGIGASDMTAQVYAGMSDDDAQGTSDSNRSWTNQVAFQVRGPTNALLAECTATAVGGNVRLSWTTVDSVAREFNYMIFGEVPALPFFGDPNTVGWNVDPATIERSPLNT